jgi:hypothetical protein
MLCYEVHRPWKRRKCWTVAADDGEFLGFVRRDDPTGSGHCLTYKATRALQFGSRDEAEAWIAARERLTATVWGRYT